LTYQGVWRRIGLAADLEASEQLRISVASQLENEPETQAVREREARTRELEEQQRAAALEQARKQRVEEAARPRRAVEQRIAELKQTDPPSELDKKELDPPQARSRSALTRRREGAARGRGHASLRATA
jgi:hypothetical protein